ncbi:unnamed protein product [Schistosoma curassoni]|uniref:TPR_REGION domain-containing protein n=1 Tax=Schistosoma curassoni TaxID=6186 RepID=A0A183K2Z4_9TREM|nr:unnamed protein product [Schistosoma curassoni]
MVAGSWSRSEQLVLNQDFRTRLGGSFISTNPVNASDIRLSFSEFRKQHPCHEKSVSRTPLSLVIYTWPYERILKGRADSPHSWPYQASEQPEHMKEARELLDHWSVAITLFQRSINSQSDWIHYHHLCYWELIWCYALQADWQKAILYTEKLALESRWSQASYRYMKAAFLLQSIEDRTAYEMKNHDGVIEKPQEVVDQLLTWKLVCSLSQKAVADGIRSMDVEYLETLDPGFVLSDTRQHGVPVILRELVLPNGFDHVDIPHMIKRFGGRSLPIEKIALRKSSRYFAQNKRLTLPALELIFIWNGFKMIQSQPDAITAFIMICENKINELFQNRDTSETFYDDYCLALMLKGVCLRCRGQAFQAYMCFTEIIQSKRKLKMDTYLLPYCEMELCHLSYEEGEIDEAVKHLEKALSYKNYHLESRLHFRIHEMDTRLKENKRKLSSVTIHQEQQSPIMKKAGSEYFLTSPSIFSNNSNNNNNNSDNKSISSFKSVDIPANYSSLTSTSESLTVPSSSSSTITTTTTKVKGALSARNLSHSKNSSVETLSLSSDARRLFDEDDLDDDETFIMDYIQDE